MQWTLTIINLYLTSGLSDPGQQYQALICPGKFYPGNFAQGNFNKKYAYPPGVTQNNFTQSYCNFFLITVQSECLLPLLKYHGLNYPGYTLGKYCLG